MKTRDLIERLRGLATLRQHAVNTMPDGILEAAKAKAVADIGTLTEAAGRLEAIQKAWDKHWLELDAPIRDPVMIRTTREALSRAIVGDDTP